jgi:hypothetical protein
VDKRPENCFEKICGSLTSEDGKAKRQPGTWKKAADAREHRYDGPLRKWTKPLDQNAFEKTFASRALCEGAQLALSLNNYRCCATLFISAFYIILGLRLRFSAGKRPPPTTKKIALLGRDPGAAAPDPAGAPPQTPLHSPAEIEPPVQLRAPGALIWWPEGCQELPELVREGHIPPKARRNSKGRMSAGGGGGVCGLRGGNI